MHEQEQVWFDTLRSLINAAIVARQQQASSRDHLQFERLLQYVEEELQELQWMRRICLERRDLLPLPTPGLGWEQTWINGIANNLHNLAFLLHGELSARVDSQGRLLQAYTDVHTLLEESYKRVIDPAPLQLPSHPQNGMPVDEVRAMLFGSQGD